MYKPIGGKQMAGGQRLRWADIVSKDLRICSLGKDWRAVKELHRCHLRVMAGYRWPKHISNKAIYHLT